MYAVGDRVPADMRVLQIKSACLRVDQAILTGESASVDKDTQPCTVSHSNGNRSGSNGESKGRPTKQSEQTPGNNASKAADSAVAIHEQHCMLFAGTTVTMGRARACVVHTSINTSIGRIQRYIVSSSAGESERTPLQRRLDEFGDRLAVLIWAICAFVWLINVPNFRAQHNGSFLAGAVHYFKTAVALAVAAIPEGLAVVITTCLALGTRRMARKKAIVRTLPSVETLGCTTIICADKTGTLTQNAMTVRRIILVGDDAEREYAVTGEGYDFASGHVLDATNNIVTAADDMHLRHAAQCCALCNDASIKSKRVSREGISEHPNKQQGQQKERLMVGEPTEAALLVLAHKLVPSIAIDGWADCFPRLHTLDFDRERKSMSVLCRMDHGMRLYVKGAPESILARCTGGDGQRRERLLAMTARTADRVLALAYRDLSAEQCSRLPFNDPSCFAEIESSLTFIALVTMHDPPRPSVPEAIRRCRQAGIRIVVITGDAQGTAEAVCRSIGLEINAASRYASLTGTEWDALSPYEQTVALEETVLFSRTDPAHKLRIVQALKGASTFGGGNVVAMTGDGVNDAPALRAADIGIAMGSGTDAARLASDIVLADSDFATIVDAVEEGRAISANTRLFIRYLVSSNIGEVVAILFASMPIVRRALYSLSSAVPGYGLQAASRDLLSPVQLLWVNLVTDGLPATAIGFNPVAASSMLRPPRPATESVVDRWMCFRYATVGIYVGLVTVLAPLMLDAAGGADYEVRASSMSLSVLVTVEMFNALNALSEDDSLLALPPTRNPALLLAILVSMLLHFGVLHVGWMAGIFGTCPLSAGEWLRVVSLSAPIVVIDEVLKWISRRRRQAGSTMFGVLKGRASEYTPLVSTTINAIN